MSVPTVPYYPITHDDGLDIIDALNNLAEAENSPSLIAEDFDETKSYAVGDYVIYSTLLYRFITPHSAGTWNENHVTPIKVGEELNTFNNEKINNNAIAPEFRNDVNYAVGDVISYQGGLYRYLLPHIAGNWDRTEVVATNAISEGGGGGNNSSGVGDTIIFDGHNMIINSSERAIDSLESSIAIVATGDTHFPISTGQYVYVKEHEDLNEGLYIASNNIAENGTLSSLNLNNVSSGGLNSLKNNINAIDSSLAIVSDSDTHVAIASGQYVYVKNHSTLTEGLYTANSSIGVDIALTTSNLTRVQSNGVDIGGLNKLNEKIVAVESRKRVWETTMVITPDSSGNYYYNISHLNLSDRPTNVLLTMQFVQGFCMYHFDSSTKDSLHFIFNSTSGDPLNQILRVGVAVFY